MNLGGAMFWTLDLDDFRGTKCDEGKYPLINTAKNIVNGGQSSTRPVTTPTTPRTTTTPIDQTNTAASYCVYCKSFFFIMENISIGKLLIYFFF